MYVIQDKRAMENGSAVFSLVFRDEANQPVTPKTMKWTLCDQDGAVVNNREDETGLTLEPTTKLLLYGDDLAIFNDTEDGFRVVIFTGTYDSDLGNDIPLVDQFGFYIERLAKSKNPVL